MITMTNVKALLFVSCVLEKRIFQVVMDGVQVAETTVMMHNCAMMSSSDTSQIDGKSLQVFVILKLRHTIASERYSNCCPCVSGALL